MLGTEVSQGTRFPRWFWVLVGLIGLGVLVLGLMVATAPFVFPRGFGAAAVAVAGYGLVATTLGVGLLLAGLRGWQGTASPLVYSKWGWLVLLLVSVAFAVVGGLLPTSYQDRAGFAPFHFAVITLPGLMLFLLVNLAIGRGAAISVRRTALALAGGAAGIILAIPVELIGLLFSAMLSAGVVAIFPGGSAKVQELVSLVMTWSQNPPTSEADLLTVLASPVVLLTLVLTLAVVTPLVEELGKTVLLGLFSKWVKPSLATGFVLGAACGLGFAWLEGVSNGAIGLGGTGGWLANVGMRFFATAMHMLASGLLGVGWAAFWRGRHWILPAAYAAAVLFHGLWNFNVIVSLAGLSLANTNPSLGGVLATLGVVVELGLLAIAMVSLIGVPLVLRRRAHLRAHTP